jgi:ADP-ribose pyrophosphatase YjhB (NUDIX family)
MPKNKPLSESEFKKIYSKVVRLCVDLVIKTPEGIILTKRSIKPYKDMWHLPGGTVLLKEKLTDSVKRVARDELGLEVGIDKFLGFIYYPSAQKEKGYSWIVSAAFLAWVESGKIEKNEDTKDIKIFKKLPEDIIKEQKNFLKHNNLLK